MLMARSLMRAFFSSEKIACAIAPFPNVCVQNGQCKGNDQVCIYYFQIALLQFRTYYNSTIHAVCTVHYYLSITIFSTKLQHRVIPNKAMHLHTMHCSFIHSHVYTHSWVILSSRTMSCCNRMPISTTMKMGRSFAQNGQNIFCSLSTGYSCWKLYVTSLVVVKVAVAQ